MEVTPLLVYGAGGAGREFVAALRSAAPGQAQHRPIGFVDDDPALHGRIIDGVAVLGGHDLLVTSPAVVAVAVATSPAARAALADRLIARFGAERFPPVIGPGSWVSPQVALGTGTVFALPFNLALSDVRIGHFAWINGAVRIGHDVTIGDHTVIYNGIDIGGDCTIGTRCMIGSGAVLLPGVTIGDDATVGGGAVVTADVAPGTTVVGVPARPLRRTT